MVTRGRLSVGFAIALVMSVATPLHAFEVDSPAAAVTLSGVSDTTLSTDPGAALAAQTATLEKTITEAETAPTASASAITTAAPKPDMNPALSTPSGMPDLPVKNIAKNDRVGEMPTGDSSSSSPNSGGGKNRRHLG